MVKTILKELIITLLLCIAIALILGIIFYNYNPMNKVVPSMVDKYTTSDTLKEEINVNILTYEATNVVYTVEDTDLNVYIKNKSYVQGKANPFEATSSTSGTPGQTSGTATDGNGSSSTSNNENINSDGTFWNSTKTK